MSILNFFRSPSSPDINRGMEVFANTPGALLVDVRNPDEYSSAHLPGSTNIPLPVLHQIKELAPDLQTPIFIHCRSGGRSRRAADKLRGMGYQNVTDIGGMIYYRGR